MQLTIVLRTFGILLMLFSVSLLPPVLVSAIYDDGELFHFATILWASLVAGLILWLPFRTGQRALRNRDGFVIVGMFWLVIGLISAVPFLVGLGMSPAWAVFEAISAFTTTGATVIVGLDELPKSILFYRQQLQWLGGIGVVVTAVALLPMMGVGGMQLVRAEATGPMKEEKLTPRINNTAKALWKIYGVLTLACALAYWLAGMDLFDAIAHSFSTVSTAGFSTHDASLAYFDSPLIEAIAVVFMLLGSISFALHFTAWHNYSPRIFLHNAELRVFLGVALVLSVIATVVLVSEGTRPDVLTAARFAVFEVVSVITTTGFSIEDFSAWPAMLPVLLIFAAFMGGCAGSTSGGMKTIRFVVLFKQGILEISNLIHPNLVRPLKIENRVVPQRVVQAVWGFFAAYMAAFAVFMLSLMMLGLDQITAFGAVAATLNNLGPGLGAVSSNFTGMPDAGLWLMSFAMLLGRLEIFTLLVLLTPGFWRR
ncbi:MAG: TrkH family potassium uptake protein [Gammaproteobacteria bacterium]|nr:TrkH family potassium uptake protein [Gammaproteobacteria bacterium]